MRKTVLLVTTALLVATSVLLQNGAHARGPGAAAQITIPAGPAGLSVTELSSSSISIAWTDNSTDEDGFKIERCTGSNCTDFQLLATMPTNVASITDWGLSKNRTYKYRMCAYNSAGDSCYTNTTTATTLR